MANVIKPHVKKGKGGGTDSRLRNMEEKIKNLEREIKEMKTNNAK